MIEIRVNFESLAQKLIALGVRDLPGFEQVKDELVDLTMSCDRNEAIGQMETFMKAAVFHGQKVRDDSLRCQFLAAYDLWTSLKSHKQF